MMYFPKGFHLSDAIRYAEWIRLAYDQRRAATEGRPWTLPPNLVLLAELSYLSKIGRTTARVPAGFAAREGRTVYVVFRGTETPEEWVKNVKIGLAPYEGYGNVHLGFKEIFDAFEDSMLSAVSAGGANKVVCVGHSLGSAYALFAAIEIERRMKKKVAAIYTYASPRVGDGAFAETFNRDFGRRSFRVVNTSDLVPSLPPPCPVFSFGGYFSHVDTPVDFTVQKNGIRDNHGIGTYLEYLKTQRQTWF